MKQFIILLISLCFVNGCAPVFSELQTAETAGKGKLELTPSAGAMGNNSNGLNSLLNDQAELSLQAAYGVTDRLDARARYQQVFLNYGDTLFQNATGAISVGLKYAIFDDKLSVYLPVGNALNNNYSDSWQAHPTVLYTVPVYEDYVKLTLAPKYIWTWCEGCQDFIAGNINFALSPQPSLYQFMVEFGVMQDFDNSEQYHQLSIGFVWSLNLANKAN